ncbi:MAG TPA: pitrilysin family protein [Thermoanaerobaculia bacterium]
MRIEHYTLPNGLRVVLNEDHAAPLVAVNIWYHVGSKNEKPGRTGIAHLFEHMLFSGSQHVGNNEHFRHVQSVGGTLNGSTTFDRTNYFETLPSNYLELGLWLESDRMGFFLPALDRKKLDIQKDVVKEERRLRYDNAPYGTAFENLLRLAYPPDYPYHWPTIGSMDDLTAAQLEDVMQFFRTYYAPNNAVLTLAGDFDPAEARFLVEKYFGSIPAGAPLPPFATSAPAREGERRDTVRGAVQLPRIYRLYHLPKLYEQEWLAGDLLTNVLATGKASRLHRALVYEQQIAQDVTAFVFPSESTGIALLVATAKEGISAEKLETALDAEIENLAENGISEDELNRVKNQTETDYAHQIEDYSDRADLLNMFTTYFNDPNMLNQLLDRYRAVTVADVQQAAAKYFVASNRVTLYYLPLDAATTPEEKPGTTVGLPKKEGAG